MKETADFIGCLLILLMVISGIGIGFYGLYILSSSKKKATSGLKFDSNIKFTPLDKPFEGLWDDSGCIISFDMDGANRGKLDIYDIRICHKLPPTCNSEDVYRDALLKLIKDGKRYRRLNNNNPDLRKFCIVNTNDCTTLHDRITKANILYDYINTGAKFKIKEDQP